MVIGGVCGLGRAKLASMEGMVVPGIPGGAVLMPVVLVLGSAFLSTLPDIDESSSWIAQRVRFVMTVATRIIGALIGWMAAPLGRVVLGPLLGTLVRRRIRLHRLP
jgi:hypothetical protein